MHEKLYRELLLRYNELERENKRFAEDNSRLKQQLGFQKMSGENVEKPIIEAASVNKYSSSKEKIDLFRSLFCGRKDVFAKRWQSMTSVRSGYQPVCENEWAYLSIVKRLNANMVEGLVVSFGRDGELGKLVNESDGKPWETKKKMEITHSNFPMVLNIVRANMLYIPTALELMRGPSENIVVNKCLDTLGKVNSLFS